MGNNMKKNKVELIGYYGGDEIIACSAWTSTSRDLTPDKRGRIGKMITDLWTAGHKIPFEKGIVHFLVDTDIASHIHLLKHRISSLNGESARYKELKEDKFYIPEDWKDGAALGSWGDKLIEMSKHTNGLYHECLEAITPLVGRKRAKESARYFKMYNSQIEADVMFNMSSFANLCKLRDSGKAQLEIREIVKEMARLVLEIEGNPFKHTMAAFGYTRENIDGAIISPEIVKLTYKSEPTIDNGGRPNVIGSSDRTNVLRPNHYGGKDNPYEAIKVIDAWNLGFNLGNVIKYVSRAGKKDPAKAIEDLEKAATYLQFEISKRKSANDTTKKVSGTKFDEHTPLGF